MATPELKLDTLQKDALDAGFAAAFGGAPHQSSPGSEEPGDDSFSPRGEAVSPRLFGAGGLTDVGWCSAQRIYNPMIAGGNHTLIHRWQKSLIFDGRGAPKAHIYKKTSPGPAGHPPQRGGLWCDKSQFTFSVPHCKPQIHCFAASAL